ncbi:DNA alkylation repair protein [Herbiconiux sp. UC225_62]|uniref:DNA alkylation repair protein n=1 Tax=Herbiconiux sp. UC225_62 TaxID=3350168 RepID=UPI0036D3196A
MDAERQAAAVVEALAAVADEGDAAFLARFFKTGPGEYGEGDRFIGVRAPATRKVAKAFAGIDPAAIDILLDSPVHEHRLAALFLLRGRFDRARGSRTADAAIEAAAVEQYLAAVRRGRVNNWDLVDSSAGAILGEWLLDKPRDLIFDLVRSDVLWERRVGVLATLAFIQAGDASTTLEIAPLLLDDRQDLMHKAVGWMLREVGKRVDRSLLTGFLDEYAARMPRTMLSYATEHLTPEERARYRAQR